MAAAKPPRPAPITTMSKLEEVVAEGMILSTSMQKGCEKGPRAVTFAYVEWN
jgi:hypothetical protein